MTAPQLYLVTPWLDDTASFARDLGVALDVGDVAAVLLRLADADERTLIQRTKAVAAVVQPRGVALVLDGRPDIVARAGADGAHLTGIEAFTASVASLKPDRIAGVGSLRSRHDALLAGEGGADYVMFGEVNRQGARPPFAATEEQIGWWAGLLVVPCVGYAESLDEAALLAQARADFVALGDWIWTKDPAPAAVIAAAATRIAERAESK
jgi:thiamine-phosphate pyrophosphorylase